MTDRPESGVRPLVRGLGAASVALAVPMLARPNAVARLAGVDDSSIAPLVVRAVGGRELLHAAALFAGPPAAAWTRVAGDALDLTLLARALAGRDQRRARALALAAASRLRQRRTRTAIATAAVAGIAAVDVYAAARSLRGGQHGRGRPGPLEATGAVTIRRTPQEVYDYWRDFEKLPTFMRHLESVSVDDAGRSTWTAKAPVKKRVTWQAELTGDEPGRRLSWKSLPGADIDNSGTVHFAETPDGSGTELRVRLHYDIPGGAAGRLVARLAGEHPDQQVSDDLRRFKQILETGDVTRSDAMPDGPDSTHQMPQRPAHPVETAAAPSSEVQSSHVQSSTVQTSGAQS